MGLMMLIMFGICYRGRKLFCGRERPKNGQEGKKEGNRNKRGKIER